MLKIRLKRMGSKKRPFYRIVVMNIHQKRDGGALQRLGYYNPLSRELKLDKQAAQEWISKGAQPTDTVKRLLTHAPETNEVIVLEKVRKERLSKKAEARAQEETRQREEAAKAAEEAKATAAAEAAAAAAAPAVEEAPAAEEAAPAEEPAAEEAAAE